MSPPIHLSNSGMNRDAPVEQLGASSGPQPMKDGLACAISSEALLRGQPSVSITHQGATYRLQTTRQGKLILTK